MTNTGTHLDWKRSGNFQCSLYSTDSRELGWSYQGEILNDTKQYWLNYIEFQLSFCQQNFNHSVEIQGVAFKIAHFEENKTENPVLD